MRIGECEARVAKLKARVPPSALKPHATAIASSRVDLPEPLRLVAPHRIHRDLGRAMDGAVHATTAGERGVRRVDDGVDVERGDVAPDDLDHGTKVARHRPRARRAELGRLARLLPSGEWTCRARLAAFRVLIEEGPMHARALI